MDWITGWICSAPLARIVEDRLGYTETQTSGHMIAIRPRRAISSIRTSRALPWMTPSKRGPANWIPRPIPP